jgi:hypothetical protein
MIGAFVKRLFPVILALTVLLLVAGCGGGDGGGGGSDRLSKADYEKQMGQVGTKLQQSLTGITSSFDPKSTPQEAAPAIQKLGDALDQAGDQVDDINPPENIDRPHKDFAAGIHQFADDVRGIAGKAKAGDRNAVKQFSQNVASLASAKKLQTAANQIKAKGYNIGS